MNVSGLETIQRDYADDVDFYYIYKSLAHPNLNGYVEPHTLAERVLHVKEASRVLDTKWTWLIDNMDNDFKEAMGRLPNSEFVIDAEGNVVRSRIWSNADELRADLEQLIGPVEDPTTIDELDMTFQSPPELAPSGVVPGIEREGRMRSLKVAAKPAADAKEPFYVKLRAEAGNALLNTGNGDVILSFRPDPIYGVHWNNMVEPIRVEIETPDGVEISERSFTGPTVQDHESDSDPREFLIEISGESDKPLVVTAHYFACTDQWCNPFTSVYEVFLERDPDGGSAMTRRMDFTDQRPRQRNRPGRQNENPQIRRMFDMMDANGDGKLTADEAPGNIIEDLDKDGDGSVSFEEAAAEFRRQGGPGGGDDAPVPDRVRQMFERMDANDDGKLSSDELPERMRQRFDRLDGNGDGAITLQEFAAAQRGRRGGNRGGGGNGGE